MSKIVSFAPYDCSSLQNYLAWSQSIGNALSSFGWTRTTDSGQVTWANVTEVSGGVPNTISAYNFHSSWVGGTAYNSAAAGGTSADVVVSGGLTYICVNPTQYAVTAVIQNPTISSTLSTAVSGAGVYTCNISGQTSNSLAGVQFVASGGSVAANNGTFVCTANTASGAGMTVTLANFNAVSQSTGTLPSLSASSSIATFVTASTTAFEYNAMVGLSVITTNCGGSGGDNNATFTVTASHSTGYVCGSVSGTSEGSVTGQITLNTAPASDLLENITPPGLSTTYLGRWVPYNYEVWQSNDSLSSANPIYIRLAYFSTSNASPFPVIFAQIGGGPTSGTGYLTGNSLMNGGTEIRLTSTSGSAQGNTLFECDFSQYEGSFAMFLWRNAYAANVNIPAFLAIDRAKDNYGNDLSAYEQVICTGSAETLPLSQVIFPAQVGGTGVMPFCSSGWTNIIFPTTGSSAHNGVVTAIPIFPIVGFVGNPCMMAVLIPQVDAVAGQLQNVILYGAQHTYLLGNTNNALLSSFDTLVAATIGIRWD